MNIELYFLTGFLFSIISFGNPKLNLIDYPIHWRWAGFTLLFVLWPLAVIVGLFGLLCEVFKNLFRKN